MPTSTIPGDIIIEDTLTVDTTLVFSTGSITDTGGSISFGDENLSTTGTAAATKFLGPEVKTDTTTPTDLTITTGAAKTLMLATPVYKDINLGGAILSPAPGLAPGQDEYKDSTGADTGIATYAIAVGEAVDGSFELQHDYAEGTNLAFHVHWQGIAAPGGGTDNLQWQLTYTLARDGVALAAATQIVKEIAFTTQYAFARSDFAAIVGTNFKIGDQFLFRLERIAASSDEYGGEALLATCGVHYQVDTLGSRSILTK